jgi:hypothetical protein
MNIGRSIMNAGFLLTKRASFVVKRRCCTVLGL